MKWKSVMRKAFLLVVSLFTFVVSFFTLAPTVVTQAWDYEGASNASPLWTIYDANGTPLGNPQVYNPPIGGGWEASISGASWIWLPNVTGASSDAANTEFSFRTQIWICGPDAKDLITNPKLPDGTIELAADNSAEVFLFDSNDVPISVGSSTSHSTVTTINVDGSLLHTGPNRIEVKVKNLPGEPGCTSYQCNPAGFVFKATFRDNLPVLPTCAGGQKPGTSKYLSGCPAGQIGSIVRICGCYAGAAFPVDVSTCQAAPVTCTGADGITKFNVGDPENPPPSCPAGQEGSASRKCQANGSWGATDFSGCKVPPVTCTGADGITKFKVGDPETVPLSCPAYQEGLGTRTCQDNGSWSQPSGTCKLRSVGVGAMCRDNNKVEIGTCPMGTTCRSTYTPPAPRPAWCWTINVCKIFTLGLCPTPSVCDARGIYSTDGYCSAP